MTNRYSIAAALLIVSVLLLAARPTLAIENGKADPGKRPVGALGFVPIWSPSGPPLGFCTGFVISDAAFVTAAHCTASFSSIALSFEVTLAPGSARIPVIEPGTVQTAPLDLGTLRPILTETVTATGVDYCSGATELPGLIVPDVAVLTFPAGTFAVRPVRLPRLGFVDDLDSRGVLYNSPAHLSGYGAAEELTDGEVFVAGYRQRGLSKVSAVVTDPAVGAARRWLLLEPTEIFDADPLSGDSGSPLFMLGKAVALKGRPLGFPLDNAYRRLDTADVLGCLMNYTTR
jgi:hypothetical protein